MSWETTRRERDRETRDSTKAGLRAQPFIPQPLLSEIQFYFFSFTPSSQPATDQKYKILGPTLLDLTVAVGYDLVGFFMEMEDGIPIDILLTYCERLWETVEECTVQKWEAKPKAKAKAKAKASQCKCDAAFNLCQTAAETERFQSDLIWCANANGVLPRRTLHT